VACNQHQRHDRFGVQQVLKYGGAVGVVSLQAIEADDDLARSREALKQIGQSEKASAPYLPGIGNLNRIPRLYARHRLYLLEYWEQAGEEADLIWKIPVSGGAEPAQLAAELVHHFINGFERYRFVFIAPAANDERLGKANRRQRRRRRPGSSFFHSRKARSVR
jgi:hypothetical protein